MDLQIAGKKALVCAASKGLGKASALALAQEGVDLFICARNEESLIQARQEITQSSNVQVHYQPCDLTDTSSRNQLINKVKNVFGGIDILLHNVGGPKPTTVEETTLIEWQESFVQLFQTVVALNQAFLPLMKEKRWGRILTVTSSSAYEPIANLAQSNAMRAAVTAMLKTLADEVAAYNISVNCIAPGVIFTDRTEERIKAAIAKIGGSREVHLADYTKSIPSGRLGKTDEFGAVVAFLASEKASYITGATIVVDGGKRRSTV